MLGEMMVVCGVVCGGLHGDARYEIWVTKRPTVAVRFSSSSKRLACDYSSGKTRATFSFLGKPTVILLTTALRARVHSHPCGMEWPG